MKYQLVTIEATHDGEGWSENDIHRYDVFYDISDDEAEDEILHRLCTEEKEFPSSRFYLDGSRNRATFLKPEAEEKFQINDLYTEYIYVEDAETFEPIARLELVEDYDE